MTLKTELENANGKYFTFMEKENYDMYHCIECRFDSVFYEVEQCFEKNTVFCTIVEYDTHTFTYDGDDDEQISRESRTFSFDVYGDQMISWNHLILDETLDFFKELSLLTKRWYTFHKEGMPYMTIRGDKVIEHSL